MHKGSEPCAISLNHRQHGDRLHYHSRSAQAGALDFRELTTPSDLSQDARIKYCSDSIEDVLGYKPREVMGKSCWEYFHPDEIPFAREIHGRGVSLDKVAVLNYAQVRHRDGSWVGCECVFTVVHDVLVASTSIYRRGPKARRTSPPLSSLE